MNKPNKTEIDERIIRFTDLCEFFENNKTKKASKNNSILLTENDRKVTEEDRDTNENKKMNILTKIFDNLNELQQPKPLSMCIDTGDILKDLETLKVPKKKSVFNFKNLLRD